MTTAFLALAQAAVALVPAAESTFWHLDGGQTLIAALIAIVGWFLKREIATFGKRLDTHEQVLMTMTATVSRVVGELGMFVKMYDRRGAIRNDRPGRSSPDDLG